jgi:hypothetical protein
MENIDVRTVIPTHKNIWIRRFMKINLQEENMKL